MQNSTASLTKHTPCTYLLASHLCCWPFAVLLLPCIAAALLLLLADLRRRCNAVRARHQLPVTRRQQRCMRAAGVTAVPRNMSTIAHMCQQRSWLAVCCSNVLLVMHLAHCCCCRCCCCGCFVLHAAVHAVHAVVPVAAVLLARCSGVKTAAQQHVSETGALWALIDQKDYQTAVLLARCSGVKTAAQQRVSEMSALWALIDQKE
jgi:hypothetical protein